MCLKLREEQCIEACGLSVGNLEDLSNNIHQNTQIIFEFLYICRQGLSQHFAAILANKSQSSISQNFGSVLENLSHSFVPNWLSSSAFSRDSVINENTPNMFKELFPNVRGCIDGTYFYSEKSQVFDAQRKTYNSHKGRNLLKEMAVVLPNGKFFDFIGPIFSDGDHSDEWMWIYIMENNLSDIKTTFKIEEDEFLADRGFLHIENEEDMFTLQCPIGLKPKQRQLSNQDANKSRLITRFRNVIERSFGRLKLRWKILGNTISTNLWPKLHSLLRALTSIF